MPSRTGKQIRDRYLNSLDPGVSKNKFSQAEDEIIIKYFKIYGTVWSKIAKLIPGRTADTIKNRFYTSLKKRINFEKQRKNSYEPLIENVQNNENSNLNQNSNLKIKIPITFENCQDSTTVQKNLYDNKDLLNEKNIFKNNISNINFELKNSSKIQGTKLENFNYLSNCNINTGSLNQDSFSYLHEMVNSFNFRFLNS